MRHELPRLSAERRERSGRAMCRALLLAALRHDMPPPRTLILPAPCTRQTSCRRYTPPKSVQPAYARPHTAAAAVSPPQRCAEALAAADEAPIARDIYAFCACVVPRSDVYAAQAYHILLLISHDNIAEALSPL